MTSRCVTSISTTKKGHSIKRVSSITITLLISLMVWSCSDEMDLDLAGQSASTIYGKWNWLVSTGGIAGHTLMPPPVVRFEYVHNGLFFYNRNDTLVATTTFLIRREKTFSSTDTCDVIHYRDSMQFVPQAFRVDNDTLKLSDLCIDCYNHAYRRMR